VQSKEAATIARLLQGQKGDATSASEGGWCWNGEANSFRGAKFCVDAYI